MNIIELASDIAERLQLKESAERDALAGIPAADATVMTNMEMRAVAEAKAEGQKQIESLGEHVRTAEKLGGGLESAMDKARLQLRTSQNLPPPNARAMDNAFSRYKNEQTAYNLFKQANGLTRDAIGDDRRVQIAWALMVVVVEAVFNAHFFGPASEKGLLGGWTIAFFVSFINVGFAFLAGALGLRYVVNHQNPAYKLFGLAWSIACFCAAAVMVSLSALYRGYIDADVCKSKALSEGSEGIGNCASEKTMDAVRALDLGEMFSSVDSVMLFLIGVLCLIFAALKGYEYDDPYPGFGAMNRTVERANEAFEDADSLHQSQRTKWMQSRQPPLTKADRDLEEAATLLQTEIHAIETAKLADTPEDTQKLAEMLLADYRSANARPSAERPSYFNQFPGRDSQLEEAHRQSKQRAEEMLTKGAAMLEESKRLRGEIRRLLAEE